MLLMIYLSLIHDSNHNQKINKSKNKRNDGDYVVFDIFQKNHNTCKRNRLGTYRLDLQSFVVAYAKQQRQDNENGNGNGYEVDDEVMEFLQCQQYYYNNNMVSADLDYF